jgi:hypothetical protein
MKKIVSLAAGLALVAGVNTAQAQSATDNTSPWTLSTTVSVTVPTILRLSLDDTTTAIPAPTETDFDAGSQDVASAITATVKANRGYTLNIRGGAATWSGGSGTKAVGDLRWRTGGAAPGTAMTTSDAVVATTGAGTSGAGTNYAFTYNIAWSYASDTPGTYTLPVIFTATAP